MQNLRGRLDHAATDAACSAAAPGAAPAVRPAEPVTSPTQPQARELRVCGGESPAPGPAYAPHEINLMARGLVELSVHFFLKEARTATRLNVAQNKLTALPKGIG